MSSAVVATREPVTTISGCGAAAMGVPLAARSIQIKWVISGVELRLFAGEFSVSVAAHKGAPCLSFAANYWRF